MQRRKGFTLVELVVVIAVIAILAGVMIGTFASVINRANESAKLQEMKAQEIEQKADDLIKKIDNSNWLGWEDFEASIVDKMTQVFKASSVNGGSISVSDVQKAVKDALKEYTESATSQNTQLTEEQVKTIVEDAIGKISYNGVTEAQVKAIVTQAVSAGTASQLTAAQVKSIVNAANANNLTAVDVTKIITDLGLATSTKVDTAVTQITTALSEATANVLTVEELESAILDLLPVTFKVAKASDLTKALNSVNSFSTLNFTSDYGPVVIELADDDNRTLTITGVKLSDLTVDAPVATIYLVSAEGKVLVKSTADNSFHVSANVDELTVNKGRVVVETGATVTDIKAAPSKLAVITVEVQPAATVGTFDLEYQKIAESTETVKLVNDGTVSAVKMSKSGDLTTALSTDKTSQSSTNVVVTSTSSESATTTQQKIAEATTAVNINTTITNTKTTQTVATTTTTEGETSCATVVYADPEASLVAINDVYQIRTAAELRLFASLVNGDDASYRTASYLVVNDIDISNETWIPAGNIYTKAFAGTFDGGNKNIVGMTNYANYEYFAVGLKSLGTQQENIVFAFFGFTNGNAVVNNVNLVDIDVNIPNTEEGGGVAGGLVGYTGYNQKTNHAEDWTATISNCTVSGKIRGYDVLGAIVGRADYGTGNTGKSNTTISNCSVDVDITGTRTANSYCRVGHIVGFANDDTCTLTGCSGKGTLTIPAPTRELNVAEGNNGNDLVGGGNAVISNE